MIVYNNPLPASWEGITARPAIEAGELFGKVQPIMDAVKANGDEALKAFALQYDGVTLQDVLVSSQEWAAAENGVSPALAQAMAQAAANIRAFHQAQLTPPQKIETMPGVVCWRQMVGIERVGLYIPGGSAPLFSTLLMLAIPAQLAGCKQIVLCTPPQANGSVHPAILYAARLCGIQTVAKAGGAQAIAAMVYGTASVPGVFKIFGPGNQYVTAAKQLAQLQGVAIDMPAGPSEVAVLADHTANPQFVAADLLSQAEHGADSQVILITTHQPLIEQVQAAVAQQLLTLPRQAVAQQALANSRLVYVPTMVSAIALANAYAAEHLIVATENPEAVAANITNAGSIFLGHFSPESVGDYASGTNHTLPTNGYARMYSGVSIDSFVKKITLQQLSAEGLRQIATTVVTMAEAEGLQAHARAVTIRL
ncbi:MAG: histidinol dehydrogenase [Bacteroidetes bacterium]|nr:MAG: histidinol dehydrogenase [Bacteroidota bacterium]